MTATASNRPLKTRQLRLLVALDDARNVHRAASALAVSQSAASKELKELETALDLRLFDRLPRGVTPTLAGETLIRHARGALRSLARAQEDLDVLRSGAAGQVEVGVIMVPGLVLLPQAIARLKRELPMLRIGVQLESSTVLMARLKDETLDFLVARIADPEDRAEVHFEEIADEPVCAVTRLGHPLLAEPRLALPDLVHWPWVLPPRGSVLRGRFDGMFRRAGLVPPLDVVETSAMLVITGLLRETDALHVMPREVAERYAGYGQLALLPVDLPCRMDAFGIVTRRDQPLSAAAARLAQAVRDVARELYGDEGS
jgi:DNA-binding transcriptional LysR family regulator